MTCPNCGAEVGEYRRFCGRCGAAVASTTSTPAPATLPLPVAAAPATPPSAWGSPGSAPPPAPPAPASADPFAAPDLRPPPGYGTPASVHGAPGYPPPPPPYGYAQPGPPGAPGPWYGYAPPTTNGWAVASLVLGLVGWLPLGVGSALAIVFGFIARDQITRSGGRRGGAGLATAGIILGAIGVTLWATLIIIGIINGATSTSA